MCGRSQAGQGAGSLPEPGSFHRRTEIEESRAGYHRRLGHIQEACRVSAVRTREKTTMHAHGYTAREVELVPDLSKGSQESLRWKAF